MRTLDIDTTEAMFKLALERKDYSEGDIITYPSLPSPPPPPPPPLRLSPDMSDHTYILPSDTCSN